MNSQTESCRTALSAASLHGCIEIVILLIEKGADINAKGEYYGNALVAAASGGHKAIVNMLISKEADMNADTGLYGTALSAASRTHSYGLHEFVISRMRICLAC